MPYSFSPGSSVNGDALSCRTLHMASRRRLDSLRVVVLIFISLLPGAFAVGNAMGNVDRVAQLQELLHKWGGDYNYGGIATFAHLRHVNCLVDKGARYDVAVLGIPTETASLRAGARLGPQFIREASSRQSGFRGFNHRAGFNPFSSWARLLDCGDIAIMPYDQNNADMKISETFQLLSHRPAATNQKVRKSKLIAVGGNRVSTLAALRALQEVYHQQLALVSFGGSLDISGFKEIVSFNSSIYVGHHNMHKVNGSWQVSTENPDTTFRGIFLDDIDDLGCNGLASVINSRVGTIIPVYLSIDLSIIDIGLAPGVSDPCVGGWTTRELIGVLRGIEGLNVVGAEVVGIAPMYDGEGDQTALSAAQIVYEILTSIVKKGVLEKRAEKR